MGALVVTMPESLQGREVEVRAVHASHGAGEHPHPHPHVGVVGRPTDSGIVYSLVFPAVIEGEYDLALLPGAETAMTVTVRGSEVTQASWPR